MAVFDVKAYEDGVLKPLRPKMPNLPDDLPTRYAVQPDMDAAALQERVDAVLRLWNKHAMRSGPMGQVCKLLANKHKELEDAGSDPRAPQFWTEWRAVRERRVGGQIDVVVARLTATYGPLGVVTAAQLEATAADQTGFGDADLARAAEKAKLRVVEPAPLPAGAGMRQPFGTLAKALVTSDTVTVPALLHPGLTGFGLLGGFTPPSGRPLTLDRRAAEARNQELEKLPDNPVVRAQKTAVGILISEAGQGTDLAALALHHLLVEVRARREAGAPPEVLHSLLTGRGLVSDEAALVAVTVFAERGAPVRDPMSEVADLLSEGRVVAAQQVAATLPGTEGDEAREAVARRLREVADLREKARQELSAGRDETAGDHLREALRLGADVPGLPEQLALVPAPPVLDVSAHPDGLGVRVAWRPAPGHGDDTTFRVVRGSGRTPADQDDGVEVTAAAGYAATDAGPPVGRDLHYAVFARSAGGRWSRPACAHTRVVPPVTDLHVDGEPGAVTGRWKVHPDVVAVEVTRTESGPDGPGTPITVERGRAFRDTTARDGVQYHYSVVACYPTASGGGLLRAERQVQRGTPRLEARPVKSLSASVTNANGLSVRLTWRQHGGNEVVVRRGSTPCPWAYGTVVTQADLARWGTELDGTVALRGESATLVAAVPPGRSYYVAFTLDGTDALRGQDTVADLTDPVREVRAQRFGDDVLVTWHWPAAVTAADVRWETGRLRITAQRYRSEGGCRLRGARSVRRVEVEAVVFEGDGDETRAPGVSVEVDERPSQLRYELQRRGHRLAGGVRCTITVSGAEALTEATLVLVGSRGHAMPLTVRPEEELLRVPISVRPLEPLVLPEIAVPPHLRKPYWLRCFLAEPAPALLVDPPVSQLKVS